MSVDPTAVMAEHHSGGQHGWDCASCNDGYDIPWPCEPYRLASALVAEQAKVARIEELAHRFELIPRARLLGALTARPVA